MEICKNDVLTDENYFIDCGTIEYHKTGQFYKKHLCIKCQQEGEKK
jgi:hypothetical protein